MGPRRHLPQCGRRMRRRRRRDRRGPGRNGRLSNPGDDQLQGIPHGRCLWGGGWDGMMILNGEI